eukprot:scaffold651470_cov52-Prasinocladus_malaysianus.AAC.1
MLKALVILSSTAVLKSSVRPLPFGIPVSIPVYDASQYKDPPFGHRWQSSRPSLRFEVVRHIGTKRRKGSTTWWSPCPVWIDVEQLAAAALQRWGRRGVKVRLRGLCKL